MALSKKRKVDTVKPRSGKTTTYGIEGWARRLLKNGYLLYYPKSRYLALKKGVRPKEAGGEVNMKGNGEEGVVFYGARSDAERFLTGGWRDIQRNSAGKNTQWKRKRETVVSAARTRLEK